VQCKVRLQPLPTVLALISRELRWVEVMSFLCLIGFNSAVN
jgi:hypothetical protein